MNIMRLRGSGLQVPEFTYVKNNKKIVVQGAVHIASQRFYDRIIDRMKSFDGEIHLEGIKSNPDNIQRSSVILGSMYKILALVSNLSYQKDSMYSHISSFDKVFNHDLHADDMPELFTKEHMDNIEKALHKISNEDSANVLSSVLGTSPLLTIGLFLGSYVNLDNEHVILHQRNDYAIEQALKTDKNVYLFWGAKHLEGMNDLLLQEGYSVSGVRWTTAIPMIRNLRGFENRFYEMKKIAHSALA